MAPKAAPRDFVKSKLDVAETRRRRQETLLNIRKNNKDGVISKRRANPTAPQLVEETNLKASTTVPLASSVTNAERKLYTSEDIPHLMQQLKSSEHDEKTLLHSVRGFRRLLSVENNPPAEAVLNCGAINYFVDLLSHPNPIIIFEAAWALTNVASTKHTRTVVACNAVPQLVKLLVHSDNNVREQAVWCLGNIAGDSPDLRDVVLHAGALHPLLENITQATSDSLLNNAIWTLSNCCRGKPSPNLELVAPALPVLADIVINPPNQTALVDACWALSFMSDGSHDRVGAVMSARSLLHEGIPITKSLVNLLKHESTSVVAPVLRTLSNFVAGSDDQTQKVLDAGMMKAISRLYKLPNRQIRKDLFWMLSNVAAGRREQMELIVGNIVHIQEVLRVMIHGEFEVRKEAMWVINNIVSSGTENHVIAVCRLGAMGSLASMLSLNDTKTVCTVLDCLDSILLVGERRSKDFITAFDAADGIDHLEMLQEHESNEVYNKAVHLLEQYFNVQDEDEDENLAPATDGNTFGFGVAQGKGVAQKLFEDDENVQMSFTSRTANL